MNEMGEVGGASGVLFVLLRALDRFGRLRCVGMDLMPESPCSALIGGLHQYWRIGGERKTEEDERTGAREPNWEQV